MSESMSSRRRFLVNSAGIAGGFLLNISPAIAEQKKSEKEEKEVTATEDLMREHGILRRILLVYSAAVPKLRSSAASVSPESLQKAAKLFRTFGEQYHEKRLEEAYIFPAVKHRSENIGKLTDILIIQHNRGSEITEYILRVTSGKIGQSAEPLAKSMESFVLMYRNHAAREDTILFPAWKEVLTAKELDEMGDKFEDIEHQQSGADGFENAAKQMTSIEESLGLSDLSQFTTPAPPKS